MTSRRAWIVGASSGVGRALAETLAARGWDLALTARDRADLDALGADLSLRFGVHCLSLPSDLSDPAFDAPKLAAAALADGPLEAAVVAAGVLGQADDEPGHDDELRLLLRVNFESAARLASALSADFERRGGGTIALVTSVAAHAPRARNMGYGAAKAGLEAYARALRHRGASRGVIVQAYALGYIDTAMIHGKDLALPAASAEAAGSAIADRLGRDVGVVFFPSWWRWVTLALKLLPWSVYKNLRF